MGAEIKLANQVKTEIVTLKEEALRNLTLCKKTHISPPLLLKEEALRNLTNQIDNQKQDLLNLTTQAEKIKGDIDRQYQLSKIIAETSIRIVYLQGQTKNEFGGSRVIAAREEIDNELNRLLSIIFPNSQDRSLWIQDLEQTLPPRSS